MSDTRASWGRRGPAQLNTVLRPELERAAPQAADSLVRARAAWLATCGPHLARHSEPIGWIGPLLEVHVEGREWRALLFEQRSRLTGRMRRWLPQLRGIRLVHRPEAAAEPPAPTVRPSAPSRPESEGITDPDLRRAFDGLLRARDEREDR